MAYGNAGKSAGGGRERSKGTSKGGMKSGPPGGMKSAPLGGSPQSAGKSTMGAGGENRRASSSTMSKARWDNMTDTMKRKEYGTTSYTKYVESSKGQAGPRQGKVFSSRKKQKDEPRVSPKLSSKSKAELIKMLVGKGKGKLSSVIS